MAYSELIKNFNRIRDYMREFYVYGFKSRDEYTKKSARSYDDEKRRMESILGDYMKFRHTPDGKNVFLSIDSRVSRHNPLYKAWKAKSFTDGDITLHFLILDILRGKADSEIRDNGAEEGEASGRPAPKGLELSALIQEIDRRLAPSGRTFDESTVRKKLKEYAAEGIVRAEKDGKTVRYFLSELTDMSPYADLLDFYSEVAPCGVIGSFLLDKTDGSDRHFAFKHHYITGALDNEILCALFEAISEKRDVFVETVREKWRKNGGRLKTENTGRLKAEAADCSEADQINESRIMPESAPTKASRITPLRIYYSAQNGRQYLMAYRQKTGRMVSIRLDKIVSVRPEEVNGQFDDYREKLDGMAPHLFGVSTQSFYGNRLEHVDFTVTYADNETHIPRRLEREKRCGTVEHLNAHTSRFSADVYDASELIPWIRTYLCRITEIHFSEPHLMRQFNKDLDEMYALYGISTDEAAGKKATEGGENT